MTDFVTGGIRNIYVVKMMVWHEMGCRKKVVWSGPMHDPPSGLM
jgi:hypothetical protein